MLNLSIQKFLLAISVMVLSTNVFSKEISYDYVQGIYASSTVSILGVDIDGDGFAASASSSITPNIAIVALFGTTSYDRIAGIEIDSTELSFGINAHTSVAPHTDVFGTFVIVNGEVELTDGFSSISVDDTGNSIAVGLRHMITDTVEINATLSRVDIFDDTANKTAFGARFYANDKVSLGIGYSTGDDVETLLLSVRIDLK